jgi:uncharacterized membrane protein
MHEIILCLKNNLSDHFLIYFLPLYIFGGRPTAILSAQLLGINLFYILPLVVMMDILQIPLFFYLYRVVPEKLRLRKIYKKMVHNEEMLNKKKIFIWMQFIGAPGVLTIAMLPIKGCGMWSGVLLANVLKLRKTISYALLTCGSILGCFLILGIGEAMLHWIIFFVT